MKKLLPLIITLLIIFAGCTSSNPEPEPQQPSPQGQQDSKDNDTGNQNQPGYKIGLDSPVKDLEKWVDSYKLYEGNFLKDFGDNRVLLISLGEKVLENYDVKIDKVTKLADKWVVDVSYVIPKEEVPKLEGVEYPYEVVTIQKDKKPIEIRDNMGKTVPIVEIGMKEELPRSKSFIVFTPRENAELNNSVTIEGKARVFEATFRVHIEDGHNVLAEKIVTAEEGAPEWGAFRLDLPFEKATSPSGVIIFSIENMENGELIEELNIPVKF